MVNAQALADGLLDVIEDNARQFLAKVAEARH
jgi:hypothetical protein